MPEVMQTVIAEFLPSGSDVSEIRDENGRTVAYLVRPHILEAIIPQPKPKMTRGQRKAKQRARKMAETQAEQQRKRRLGRA